MTKDGELYNCEDEDADKVWVCSERGQDPEDDEPTVYFDVAANSVDASIWVGVMKNEDKKKVGMFIPTDGEKPDKFKKFSGTGDKLGNIFFLYATVIIEGNVKNFDIKFFRFSVVDLVFDKLSGMLGGATE